MKKLLSAFLALILLLIPLFLLSSKLGQVPPPGKFVNPFSGFWANGTNSDNLTDANFPKNLKENVNVFYDSLRIPHIFAKNSEDLYFTQGYLTAQDRLWQMEFQTLTAAGRLASVAGPDLLEIDMFMRKIGLPAAAAQAAEEMLMNEEYSKIVLAYTEGVNAYINSLGYDDLPVEYKILDYEPEKWSPLKTALLLKLMSYDLTGRSKEKHTSKAAELLSDEDFNFIYPAQKYYTEPITTGKSSVKKSPAKSDNKYKYSVIGADDVTSEIGSNNWAVGGNKTKSGKAILCNDPHLGLQLPSLWYEIQLHTPDMNVYGASLPGAPGVIIGFNENISWGVTNAGSDVMDWYQIKFTDSTNSFYEYDGMKLPVKKVVEKYEVSGGETVTDTILYTHFGPVSFMPGETPLDSRLPVCCAMRWTNHDPSLEAITFIKLNQAKGYSDFIEALNYYDCPGQNFVYADKENNIAIRHQGKFPVRHDDAGRYIKDGTDSTSSWKGFISFNELPSMFNPERGFVSSANQSAIDEEQYPYYLGDLYAPFERGKRINDILRKNNQITPEFMLNMQNDNINLYAESILPVIIENLNGAALSQDEVALLEILISWQYNMDADEKAPVLFELLKDNISYDLLYDEITLENDTLMTPSRSVVQKILLDNIEKYIDNVDTPDKETLPDIMIHSFTTMADSLINQYGTVEDIPDWGTYRGTDIRHAARIPGFSEMGLHTGGSYTCVNATNKTSGPSWRMVVEMDTTVKAWCIYPGGQSGHPGSAYYKNFIRTWAEGKHHQADFMASPPNTESDKTYKHIRITAK